MSTRKLSDKELDKYFRNILKKPEAVPFDEAAWQGMSEKLAGSQSKGLIIQWRSILISLGIIGALVVFFFFFPFSNTNTIGSSKSDEVVLENGQEAEGANAKDPTLTTDTLEIAEAKPSKNGLKADAIKGSSPRVSASKSPTLLSVSANSNEIETTVEEVSAAEDAERTPVDGVVNSNKDESSQFLSLNQPGNQVIEGESEVEDPQSIASFDQEEDDEIYLIDNRISRGLFLEYAAIFSAARLDPYEQVMNVDSTEMKPSKRVIDRFRVGVSFAPDFSTVGELEEFDRAGLDFGIQLEYFITDRLSVNAGAIYTQKIYRTSDIAEYQLANGFWSNGIEPEQINADCKVIDIPLNIRYQIIQGRRMNIFLSSGLSSYLMLSEIYDYEYADPMDPTNRWRSEFENENQHFFGVYNFSFGVTRQIAKNISIEVEPFLKNSFGGVGWGEVQLKSTGALFHFKYHLGTQ